MNRRQVHLDFHTSEKIKNIGCDFSKEDFQNALKKGNVNSITVFAKCHHGWCYYPTKAGRMHPELDFDLLGAQIEAAHEIGVRAPVYITLGWSENDALTHPEWIARRKDGTYITSYPYDETATEDTPRRNNLWIDLCPNTGYGEHLRDIAREVCERYGVVDGLFFDIVFHGDRCYCDKCRADMKAMGLDPENEDDASAFFKKVRLELMSDMYDIIKSNNPDGTLFFNGSASLYFPEWYPYQTHFELEDLPTAWGGYDKLAMRAKHFLNVGKEYAGMTGKFHTDWGEFGGFKTPDALKYECAAMMAYGAGCSVGDQLHPSGKMDEETYRIIGEAYNYVEKLEPYCTDVSPTSKLGVMLLESGVSTVRSDVNGSDNGIVSILLEKQLDFNIVNADSDLSGLDVLILPDNIVLTEKTAEKINSFIKGGGGVLLSGNSGLDGSAERFLVDAGLTFKGKSPFELDYVKADKLSENVVSTPFLFYDSANITELCGAEPLAYVHEPYFKRTYGSFCSHKNTPYKTEASEYPAASKYGRVVYFAHKLCEIYNKTGSQYHRDFFINGLKLIYKNPVLEVNMMSKGRAVLWEQKEHKRYTLHLLYASPIRRGNTSVIEDIPDIYNTPVKIRTDKKIKRVYLAPQGTEVDFTQTADYVEIMLDKFRLHQLIVFDYE